jgi:hypothetical protein
MNRLATPEEMDIDFPEDDIDDEYDFDEDDEPEDEIPGVPPEDPHAHEDAPIITMDQLAAVDDTEEEKFYVEEWKANVLLKGLSMEELTHVRRRAGTKQVKMSGTRSDVINRELLIAGMVQPVVNVQNYHVLQQRAAGAIVRITNRIVEKSGMGEEAEKARERRFPRKR